MKNNDCEPIDISSSVGIRVSRDGKTLECSPEMAQRICNNVVDIAVQFISTAGTVTIEYIKEQGNMYYAQLDTFITEKALNSDERKLILTSINKLIDKIIELADQSNDSEKIVHLESMIKMYSNLYEKALSEDAKIEMPKKPKLLKGVRKLFLK